jgi:hypothetical protein
MLESFYSTEREADRRERAIKQLPARDASMAVVAVGVTLAGLGVLFLVAKIGIWLVECVL